MIKITSKKREVALDIARGIAIFLMISQHLWLLIGIHYIGNESLNFIFFLLGTVLAAPVFLFLMGINVNNSQHNTPKDFLKRGLLLIILGYLLSALRFFLPIVLAQHFNLINNPEDIIYKIKPIYYLLQVDILQLAGLSLILISFLKKIKADLKYYLIIALVISLISPFLWGLKFDYSWLNWVADLFWGKSVYVVFPFFSWAFYPLIGVYFGNLLKKSKDKLEFYKKSLNVFSIFSLFALFLFFVDLIFLRSSSYYYHGICFNLFFSSVVIVWVSFIALNYQKLSLKLVNILTFLSKNVTIVYFIQWVLIGWLAVIINLHF